MEGDAAPEKPPCLCYYCKIRDEEKTCYADDTQHFYDAKELDTAKAYWQVISEQVIKEKDRAQQIATKLSSKVVEIVKFCGNAFADLPIDVKECKNVQVDMFAMPESVRMCENCHCFFSIQTPCHCEVCMEAGYRPHYVILMHGVIADPFQMAFIAQFLLRAYPQVFIYFPHNVAGKSLLGLELILEMFSEELLALFDKVPEKIKISLIGHSFGGVILRYWLLFYYRKTPAVYCHAKPAAENVNAEDGSATAVEEPRNKHTDVEWCNYISMATPHSGIYENHVAFRKLVSFLGSKSVDQLDNESIDLMLLLSRDARDSMKQFANVVAYGNLWGDLLVAPRTSILLPYHKISEKMLEHFIKVAEQAPGVPQDVCEMLSKFDPRDESEQSDTPADAEGIAMQNRDEKMAKITKIFYATAAKKIRNTQNVKRMIVEKCEELSDGDDEDVFKQVFTQEDVNYFTLLLSKIVDRSNGKLIKRMYEHPKFLYNEVMLSGLWEMAHHKFAVYLPTICMPHHSIVTLGEVDSWHTYTKKVLSHVTYMFVV